ncbi:MAG: 1,4-alpha-glucan branching enzyme, partial [Chloroflexi bacterium]
FEVDTSWEGFQWIDLSDAAQSIISFYRRAADPSDLLVFVCNFTPVPRLGYRVGLPLAARYCEILNSDWTQFGGSGVRNETLIQAEAIPWQSCAFSAPLSLPPLGVTVLKPVREAASAS